MSWNPFRNVGPNKHKSPADNLQRVDQSTAGSAGSAIAFNIIAPTPRGTNSSTFGRPSVNPSLVREGSDTFQVSHTGGVFENDALQRAVENTRSNRNSLSGRDSIVLPSVGESEEVAAQERPPQLFIPSSTALDIPPASQVVTPTEGGLTTCYDGGHNFETKFLMKNLDLLTKRDYRMSVSVVESVRNDLNSREARFQSATDPKSWFVPCTKLHEIMTFETVCLLLRECAGKHWLEEEIKLKAKEIAPLLVEEEKDSTSFRRIFAILILIRKTATIFDFLQAKIDDSCLPFYFDDSYLPFYFDEGKHNLSNLFQSPHWKDEDIRDFCLKQWDVSPIFFSVQGRKILHYECRSGEILPFVKHKWKVNKKGGYGEVACYELHAHQQDLVRYTKDGTSRAVAVKKLYRPKSKEEFKKEYYMLDRLTQSLTTPHLAKLLATYQVPKDSDNLGSQDYFLVFECADSTLSELWTKVPEESMEFPQVSKWVALQSEGLAAALGMIHDFDKHRPIDDQNDRTHGFHGDLKPDNVLCYNNWITEDHKFGVLQITDFGLSSFHHTETAEKISIRHNSGEYLPPEAQMVLPISVSFDVWTLGCLYLDFLTWLVEGPNGREKFRKSRSSKGFLFQEHICFWEVSENKENVTEVSLSKAVINWVTGLCQAPKSSEFVRDFCVLIINRMLVIEDKGIQGQDSSEQKIQRTERISTSELVEELQKLVGKEISYYTPSQPKDPLNLDRRRHCIRVSKPVHQLLEEAEQRLDPLHQELGRPQTVKLSITRLSRRDKSPIKFLRKKIDQFRGHP